MKDSEALMYVRRQPNSPFQRLDEQPERVVG